MTQEYSTNWDIENYYDGTEPEEYWNLRKHFMEVHKGKFSEGFLVALSKAVTNIKFLASIDPAQLLATVKHTSPSKMCGSDGSKDNKPNIPVSTLKLREADNPWKRTDKIDSATVLSAEKLAPVKNEVNAKTNKENVDTSNSMKEQRPNLPYKKDQWSPSNPDGKKIYDADFLLALRNDPKSNRKPDDIYSENADTINVMEQPPNLPYKEDQWSPSNSDGKKIYDIDFLLALRKDPKSNMKPDIHSDIYRAICKKSNSCVRTDVAPAFGNSLMGKSSSQHQPPPKRKSRSKTGGSNKKMNESNVPVSTLELHEAENTRKPTDKIDNDTVLSAEKLAQMNKNEVNSKSSKENVTHQQEYPTDWDIDSYYDRTEPEEYWNLRKHFMEVHKGKFSEGFLVALSKAVTNIEFLASIDPAPLLATVKPTNLSKMGGTDRKKKESNIPVSNEAENTRKPTNKIDNATVLSAEKLAQMRKNELNSKSSKENVTHQIVSTVLAQEYPTDWDIDSYYDRTEPEEYWNLRKHFMEVHKGKFSEDYLVALSKAVTNIEFLASIYQAPLLLPTAKRNNQSKMGGGNEGSKPNMSLKLHEAEKVPTPLKQYFNGGAPGGESGFVQPVHPFLMPAQPIPYTTYPTFQSYQQQPYYYPQMGPHWVGTTPQIPQQNPTQLQPPRLPLMQNRPGLFSR